MTATKIQPALILVKTKLCKVNFVLLWGSIYSISAIYYEWC